MYYLKYECMILFQDVSKILTACRILQISIAQPQMKAKITAFQRCIYVVEMGQIKVFAQELGLKQGFLADTNMDYLTSEWPGTPNFKVYANFDMFPQKYG